MLAVVACALPPVGAAAATPVFTPAPCPLDVFAATADVDCGYVTVPESRARPGGPTITVAAAVVHAPAGEPRSDPVVFVDGGPSFGAISPFALEAYFGGAAFVENRDLILVDTRGTGLSQPRLGCPEIDRESVESWYSRPFVDSAYTASFAAGVAACRERLSAAGIDLAAYNTAESAADLDDLRQALGYVQWNLVAASADGVLGLTYMRLYPAGIRSAIIDSGQSTQHLPGLDYYRGWTALLERVFAGCASNAACDAAYPNIRTLFYDLVHRLQRHPAKVALPAFQPRPITVRVDGVWFFRDTVLSIFAGNRFEPANFHALLSEIWRSAHGELSAVYRERFGTGPFIDETDSFLAVGKTLSYVCHDLAGFITRADLEQAADDIPELAPLFLDPGYDLPVGPAGCRIWDVGTADAVQHEPVASPIPTLVLAGEYDVGVPPSIVRQIPPALPNAFYYEMPAGGHLQLADFNNASPCARAIATEFLAAPAKRPDSSCLASLAAFDFTPPAGAARRDVSVARAAHRCCRRGSPRG